MITEVCQRWTGRRCVWRPTGERFDPRRYEIAPIADDTTARAFVEREHYSRSYPPARRRFGLYRFGRVVGPRLVGVAVFSVPTRDAVLRPFPVDTSVVLGRFVLRDEVEGNAETWFLARCFKALAHEGFVGVVSFSDPEPRTTLGGETVFAGHVGTIYQASNAVYTGRAKSNTIHLLPDGTIFDRRTLVKIQKRERGWRYAVDLLVDAGAVAPPPSCDLRAWLVSELPRATRKVRHGGNHRYLFALDRAARKLTGATRPYPRFARPDASTCAAVEARAA